MEAHVSGICSSFEPTRKLKNICVSVLHFMTQECLSVVEASKYQELVIFNSKQQLKKVDSSW